MRVESSRGAARRKLPLIVATAAAFSTYPNAAPRATFCQWHIRGKQPWETIEFEWLELDLVGAQRFEFSNVRAAFQNAEDAMPGSKVRNRANELADLHDKMFIYKF